jgi:hypothetical protein
MEIPIRIPLQQISAKSISLDVLNTLMKYDEVGVVDIQVVRGKARATLELY